MSKKKSYLTFTDQFCGAGGSSQGVRAAARTVPGLEVAVAMNHWKLAIDTHSSKNLRIEDCHYRMLVPREIQSAMAFDDDYVVLGNGREKVKQLGNAVTPPVMEWLVSRCVETLN